jgi:hypothetical protein
MVEGLNQFRDMELKGFDDYLQRADAYFKGNPPPGRTSNTKKTTAQIPVGEVVEKIKHIYENAKDLTVSEESIHEELKKLEGFKKDDLLKVAEAIDLKTSKSITMPKLREEIRIRIFERRGGSIRAGFIDVNPIN